MGKWPKPLEVIRASVKVGWLHGFVQLFYFAWSQTGNCEPFEDSSMILAVPSD